MTATYPERTRMTTSDLTNLADRHQERADRLAECSRQTAFRAVAADLIADAEFHAETAAALREAEAERDAALAEVQRLRDGIESIDDGPDTSAHWPAVERITWRSGWRACRDCARRLLDTEDHS